MPNQDKLIKSGIKYTDAVFDEIIQRLSRGVKSTDTLESFLEKTKDYTSSNPLQVSGYKDRLLKIILQETNSHKFSRPAQKELVRITIENQVGELIDNVGEDIKDSVRDVVKEGYNNQLSQDEIAENISTKVTGIKNRRAKAIARTEIARTATISDYVINKERGATHFYVECRNTACPVCKEAWHKHWSKSNDESFNPHETSAGGKGWIGDKVYSMSDTLMLPPVHPNCRCVPYFISEDDIPEGITVEKPTPKQTTSNLTDEDMEKRLSEEDYKTYRMAKSNRNFSQSLLDGNRLDERGIQLHKQSIEFYNAQIKELENKALSNKSKSKSVETTTVEDNVYPLNNRENSFSNVIITKEQFEKVVNHQSKRANATLEYGNSIDNATGELARSTDIKGSKHRVNIPKLTKSYSIVHNHTNNNGFSGGDAFGQTEGHLQDVCYATTPKGIWIMRDTEFGKFRKQDSVDGSYELKSRMNSKYTEFANNGKEKYKDQYDNAKSPNEKRKIQRQMSDEVTENYNNWLLEEFAVGKRRDNLIEIEFIPIEMINNVQF